MADNVGSVTVGTVQDVENPHSTQSCWGYSASETLRENSASTPVRHLRDMDALQHWLHTVAKGTRAETPTTLGNNITAFFDNVHTGVTQRTGGWGELRTLVPLTLAFLGLCSLLLTESL